MAPSVLPDDAQISENRRHTTCSASGCRHKYHMLKLTSIFDTLSNHVDLFDAKIMLAGKQSHPHATLPSLQPAQIRAILILGKPIRLRLELITINPTAPERNFFGAADLQTLAHLKRAHKI